MLHTGFSPQKSVTTVKAQESNVTTTKQPGQNTPPIKRNTTGISSFMEIIHIKLTFITILVNENTVQYNLCC